MQSVRQSVRYKVVKSEDVDLCFSAPQLSFTDSIEMVVREFLETFKTIYEAFSVIPRLGWGGSGNSQEFLGVPRIPMSC